MNENRLFSEKRIKELVSAADVKSEYAATDWRNGLLLGNGDIGAIAYAPGGREWVINKNDVFDPRTYECDITPHASVMEILREKGEKYSYFLDKLEKRKSGLTLRSVTPVVFRLCNGNGEMGWSAPAFPKISDTLSVYDGEVRSVSDAHFIHSEVRSIVPHGRRVVAIRQEGCSICDWDNKAELYRPYHDDMENPEFVEFSEGGIAFTQTLPDGKERYAVAMLSVPRVPDVSRIKYDLPPDYDPVSKKTYVSSIKKTKLTAHVMCGGDVDIFISVISSYRESDPLNTAISEVKAAADAGYETLEEENLLWWHNFWAKSAVDFGKYTQYQRYWVFSTYSLATAFGSYPMPALSGMLYGPLNATTPGVTSHHYNTDQNIQIPLMPAPIINHPELVEPYADTFIESIDNLRAHTKRLFGNDGRGIFVPLVANQNCVELPSGCYRYTMCGSAYTGLILARCWEYTRCDRLMRDKLFKLLIELIRFYTDNLMHIGNDGLYHLDPTVPPEIFMFTRDDLSTLSMLKYCMKVALSWCKIEKIENEETKRWEEILGKYPPLATREDGSYKGGPDIPDDYFSFGTHQLYPFFPSEEYLSEQDRINTRKTIEYIDRDAIERTYSGKNGWHFIHGWSWFLYYGTLSHLGEYDTVWAKLDDFLQLFAKENGLFVHNSIVEVDSSESERNHRDTKPVDKVTADVTTSPSWYGVKCSSPNKMSKSMTAPVIEGGAIFMQLSTELLIQSFDGIVRLFPGVPSDFSGGFYRLRARGGLTVSASAERGKLKYAVFSSDVSTTVKLCDKSVKVIGKDTRTFLENGVKVISFDITAGESVDVISV